MKLWFLNIMNNRYYGLASNATFFYPINVIGTWLGWMVVIKNSREMETRVCPPCPGCGKVVATKILQLRSGKDGGFG